MAYARRAGQLLRSTSRLNLNRRNVFVCAKLAYRARVSACLQAALSIGLLALSGAGMAQSLSDAVNTAITSHPSLMSSEAGVRAATHDVRQAKAGYYPTLDIDAGWGKEKSDIKQLQLGGNAQGTLSRRDTGVTVRQLVWDGWATRSEVRRRVALLSSVEHGLDNSREAIAFQAAQAYIDVIRARELVSLARDNVSAHVEAVDRASAKRQSGVGNQADVDQATARLALARSTQTAREGALREAVATYRRVIGSDPGELMVPERRPSGFVNGDAIDRGALDAAIGNAIADVGSAHPAMLEAQAQITAADAQIEAARAAFHPQLNIEGSLRRDDNQSGVKGNRNIDTLMLVARWNLFNGGADTANKMAAVERKTVAQEAVEDVRRNLAETVTIAHEARATSEARIAFLEAYVKSSEGTLAAYEDQFELSRRTLLDVLNAENELFNARSNLASGIYDDLANQFFVEASKGRLVSTLGLSGSSP